MSFCQHIGEHGLTHTENGAITHASTGSALVDFFFHAPAMRNEQDINRIVDLFNRAFEKNPQDALRTLFYLRDIRGGQGERRVFRTILTANSNMEFKTWLLYNLELIPEYGRWDDLIPLILHNMYAEKVVKLIKMQLTLDLVNCHANKPVSLLAKWLPSENASSRFSHVLGKMLCPLLGYTPKQYRKVLTKLRHAIKIVENNLRTRDYASIDYSTVPSKAMLKYRKAFSRNDSFRYHEYLSKVNKGEAKINTSTLYPYEIYERLYDSIDNAYEDKPELETMWNNLPDYVDNISGLVVADTSGSMIGRPMAVSVSLAMYIAERNKNVAFKDYFISFSEKPKLHKIEGNTLRQRMQSVKLGDVANTNLQGVFDLVLDRAVSCHVPQEEMPKVLLIISDMEFDRCVRNDSATNLENIHNRYKKAGYTMPTICFWNVNSRNNQAPATVNDRGIILLSGCSPVCLSYALGGMDNMMDVIRRIIDSPRYQAIVA